MSLLNQSTKLAGPMGAIALTGATTILIGRQTTHKSTSKITTAANHHMTSMVQSHMHAAHTIRNTTWKNTTCSTSTRSTGTKQHFSTTSTRTGTTNTSNSNWGRGFVQWYEGHLESRPIVTKSITGSILWGVGDLVAQLVPTMIGEDHASSDGEDGEDMGESKEMKEFKYDYPRTARAVFFGFALHAPLSHVHFNFLEWMTVKGGFAGLSVPIFKTVMEQFVYWSWISNTLYHGTMSGMQGKTLQQMYDRVSDVLMDTQIAQWKFWIPVQLLNFRFVPVRHQLNVVLLTSVVWTALLSAWYPPEEDTSSEKEDGVESVLVKKEDE